MQRPKTFIILSPGFPKDEEDSVCLPAQQAFVLALKDNFPEIKIIVISFQYPYNSLPYKWKGIKVIPFAGRGRGGIHRILLWVKIWNKLKKLKKENEIAGMLSLWAGECALLGKHFSKRFNIKHRIWILGQDAKKENRYVRRIKPGESELVAMSVFLQQTFFESHGIKPQHIVPNAIDPSLYSNKKRVRDIDIMGAGSLIPLKQFDLFIRIVDSVHGQLKIRSIICGKGPEENNLRSIIQDLSLNNVIELKGELEHPEVLSWMQRTKIFLHTSSYEGFSSVCLEALYAGAHVISFCKPIESSAKHWHFVNTENEMIEQLIEILTDTSTEYSPVLLYSIQDSVREMMGLFDI